MTVAMLAAPGPAPPRCRGLRYGTGSCPVGVHQMARCWSPLHADAWCVLDDEPAWSMTITAARVAATAISRALRIMPVHLLEISAARAAQPARAASTTAA